MRAGWKNHIGSSRSVGYGRNDSLGKERIKMSTIDLDINILLISYAFGIIVIYERYSERWTYNYLSAIQDINSVMQIPGIYVTSKTFQPAS